MRTFQEPSRVPAPDPQTPFAPKVPLERLLYETPIVGIGTFRCRASHPMFRDSGPSSTYCFVFPRTSVWIQHAGERPFLANPRVVTFYNQGQEYSRQKLSADGDRGEWFALNPEVAADVLAASAPSALGRGRSVFGVSHGPSDPQVYLLQRRLVEHVRAYDGVDPLRVEETVIHLLERTARLAAGTQGAVLNPVTKRRRDLVDAAREYLARSVSRRVPLSELAASLSCSVFHLCRAFRQVQGTTLHAYQEDLRLRLALETIAGGGSDLTRVALDFGYSSHSHFTAAFRRHFGMTPSNVASAFGGTTL